MRNPPSSTLIAFGFALMAFSGCGKAATGFTLAEQVSPGGCSITTTTKSLRIFVMVDNSGSTDTTDPSQAIRVQTLQTFLGTYGGHTNLSYGFGYFDDDAYVYDVNQSRFEMSTSAAPFGTAGQVGTALTTYHASIPPYGNTGYAAAFGAIQSAIVRDEAAGYASDYAVVFMSDGQPTDISGNVTNGINSLLTQLQTATQANGTSHVAVSTVYFGSASDTTSIGNLRTMATHGGGQFVDTNHLGAGGLSIGNVITIPGC